MKQFLLQCFGINHQTGNQALVIENHNFRAEQKQAFAREQNLPACVFIDNNDKHNFTIDFYYPHKQSPMCLHGTLATAKIFFNYYPELNQAELKTKLGVCITIYKNSTNQIKLGVYRQETPHQQFIIEDINPLIGIDQKQIKNIALASVGSLKLLVELDNIESLFGLKPDLPAIAAWSQCQQINGIYAYTKNLNKITGRNLNHLDPKLEDSATGVAAGALCSYYQENLEVHQGISLNNHCLIHTCYSNNEILINGNVHLVT